MYGSACDHRRIENDSVIDVPIREWQQHHFWLRFHKKIQNFPVELSYRYIEHPCRGDLQKIPACGAEHPERGIRLTLCFLKNSFGIEGWQMTADDQHRHLDPRIGKSSDRRSRSQGFVVRVGRDHRHALWKTNHRATVRRLGSGTITSTGLANLPASLPMISSTKFQAKITSTSSGLPTSSALALIGIPELGK